VIRMATRRLRKKNREEGKGGTVKKSRKVHDGIPMRRGTLQSSRENGKNLSMTLFIEGERKKEGGQKSLTTKEIIMEK